MSKIDRDEAIRILTKMMDSRTKCQCSKQKVYEAGAFRMAIKALQMMPDADEKSK